MNNITTQNLMVGDWVLYNSNVFIEDEYELPEYKNIMESVFPELKESEDERIKREILELVSIAGNGNQFEEIKDWLEKQCEQPTDKVEPKFNVGDWIILPLGIIAHIDSLNSTDYQVTTTDGKICDFKISKQDNYRLWEIADAKDGDVLVASDGSIFLFAGVDDCACKYYVALTTDNYVKINYVKINKEVDSGYWETSRAVHPATKEQHDLLFTRMKEEGWEWDSENKELKNL